MSAFEVQFSKDRFKEFIKTTYNDWYYDRKEAWDYDDFLDLLKYAPLEADFGSYLIEKEENLIT